MAKKKVAKPQDDSSDEEPPQSVRISRTSRAKQTFVVTAHLVRAKDGRRITLPGAPTLHSDGAPERCEKQVAWTKTGSFQLDPTWVKMLLLAAFQTQDSRTDVGRKSRLKVEGGLANGETQTIWQQA
jgi:hypothetical protein